MPTPAPMPAFAPVDSPELLEELAAAVDVIVGDAVIEAWEVEGAIAEGIVVMLNELVETRLGLGVIQNWVLRTPPFCCSSWVP